jgi:hypothetical protein
VNNYREAAGKGHSIQDHSDVAAYTNTDDVDYRELLNAVKAIAPGSPGAVLFHRAVKDLLCALLFPALQIVESKMRFIKVENVSISHSITSPTSVFLLGSATLARAYNFN